MSTAIEFHEKLTEAVKDSSMAVRMHEGMRIRQVAHQGDLYLHMVSKIPQPWNVQVEGRQIALGQTTGSRHCAEGDKVTVYWPESKAAALAKCPVKLKFKNESTAQNAIGPCIDAPEGFTLTHPEHAHHWFPPGKYFTSYQIDARTDQRVQD